MEMAWDELAQSPAKFERLCDALAHRWYPDGRVRVFNGAGGDGGRDAWVDDERTVLEFKSFTTLGAPQRRQIERSLARAADHEPLRWIVMAPVKLTPTGWDWFDRLRGKYPFELIFRDVAWLNTQMAEHTDIARYVGTRPHEEVVTLLQGLHKGQAALVSGVPDLAERVTDLRGLAAEASPFWTLEFAGASDTTEIAIKPKPGSPPDHLVIELAQGPDSATVARLMEQSVLYGTGAELAPEDIARIDSASLRALGVPDGDLSFVMPANWIRDGLPLPALLRVRPTDGLPATRPLNLNFDAGVIGERGGILFGRDTTGHLRVTIVVDHPGPDDSAAPVRSVQVEYGRRKPQPGSLTTDPEALLRAVEAMAAMDQAHHLELVITGETIITGVREPPPTTGRFAVLADLLRDLILVRDTLAVPLLVPETWTGPDQIAVRAAAALLRGEETPISIDTYSWVGSPEDARTMLAACLPDGGVVDEAPLTSFTFTFAGNTLNIAPLYVRIPRVALVNVSAVQAALDQSDEEIPIELVPWPGTGAIGRMTPFPTDTDPAHPR